MRNTVGRSAAGRCARSGATRALARASVVAAIVAALWGAAATPVAAQAAQDASAARGISVAVAAPVAAPAADPSPNRPYRIGEALVYDLRLRLGMLTLGRVGTGRMEVVGIDTIRGREAYHLVFTVVGGIVGFHVNDRYESWIDTATLASLRHTQQIHEGGYKRSTTYEMFPDRSTYSENGGAERPGVGQPVDDGSFIYLVRSLAPGVGDRIELDRYFKPAQNPVILEGVRADTIETPAGRFATVVIRPTIKAGGLFAEGGRAEVWVSHDDQHVMVQLVTHVKFGSLNLTLRSIHAAPPSVSAAGVEP